MIIGDSGSGKSTSAATFPNPIFVEADNNSPANQQVISLWRPDILEQACKLGDAPIQSPVNYNLKDALYFWLKYEAPLYPPDVTLIVDSWTMFDNAADLRYFGAEMPISNKGEDNAIRAWGNKLNWCIRVHEIMKSLLCKVVVIVHEVPERDKKGELMAQISPISRGGFKDQFKTHYTDIYRQTMKRESPTKIQTYWQLVPDLIMTSVKCSFPTKEFSCEANWPALEKLMLQSTQTNKT